MDSPIEFIIDDPDLRDTIENKVTKKIKDQELAQYKNLQREVPTIMIVDHEGFVKDYIEDLYMGEIEAAFVGFSNSNESLR